MKKLLIAMVLIIGCSEEPEIKPIVKTEVISNDPRVSTINVFDGTYVRIVPIDGHEYLITRCHDGISTIHLESCWCKRR